MTPRALPRRASGDEVGIILFLHVGDPPGEELIDLLLACDEFGIAAVELAVPFPDSPTDGPTIRRSANRALQAGADLESALGIVRTVSPQLRQTRLVLLLDWAWTVRPRGLEPTLAAAAAAGADGILLHGMPPKERANTISVAHSVGMPIVTTCYHRHSSPSVLAQAAREATSYVYLVSRFGRSGSTAELDVTGVTDTVTEIRRHGDAPIAIGFGVSSRREVEQVGQTGADVAIIGSAAVLAVEEGLAEGRLLPRFREFLAELTGTGSSSPI